METARDCRIPVTVLLGVREDDGTYCDQDKIMQIAYTKYLKTICSGCGLPANITRGDDNVGRFEVHDDTMCHGCEALETFTSNKNRTTWPGQKLHLKDTHLDG